MRNDLCTVLQLVASIPPGEPVHKEACMKANPNPHLHPIPALLMDMVPSMKKALKGSLTCHFLRARPILTTMTRYTKPSFISRKKKQWIPVPRAPMPELPVFRPLGDFITGPSRTSNPIPNAWPAPNAPSPTRAPLPNARARQFGHSGILLPAQSYPQRVARPQCP